MKKPSVRVLKSATCALQGLVHLVRGQPNARLHLMAGGLVCAAEIYFRLNRTEWFWMTAAIVLVCSAEAFNTAPECLADALHPGRDPAIGRAKDVAAAAVQIAALGATVIGMPIFVPHLASLGQ